MNWFRRLFIAGAIFGPETKDRKTLRLKREQRCKAISGVFVGYQCSLEKGHDLPHEAKHSVTRDGLGNEIGLSSTTWPRDLP